MKITYPAPLFEDSDPTVRKTLPLKWWPNRIARETPAHESTGKTVDALYEPLLRDALELAYR